MNELIFYKKNKINIYGKIKKKKLKLLKEIIKFIFYKNIVNLNIIITKKKKILKISKKFISNCNGDSLVFNYNYGRLLFDFYKSDVFINKDIFKKNKKIIIAKLLYIICNCIDKSFEYKKYLNRFIKFYKKNEL